MASLRYTMGAGPVPQLQLNPDDPDTEDGCPLPDPMAEVQLPDLQRNRERACEPSPKTAAWAPARNPLHGLREGDSDDEDAGARDPAASQGSGRGARGAAQQVRTYVTFAARDMRRRKLSCCLGCASCWLVVFCMSILLSLLENVPAIFLRLAEVESGELDLQLSPEPRFGRTIHYGRMRDALAAVPTGRHRPDQYSYHAPRIVLPLHSNFALRSVEGSGGACG